jgi:hypothetical protein
VTKNGKIANEKPYQPSSARRSVKKMEKLRMKNLAALKRQKECEKK